MITQGHGQIGVERDILLEVQPSELITGQSPLETESSKSYSIKAKPMEYTRKQNFLGILVHNTVEIS